MIEAYDILSLNCELLSERIKLIQLSKECPPDLISCISTLMYAAPRVDIPELVEIRKQFKSKYGKQFDENALGNLNGVLNERVVTKLSVQPPAAYLVQTYLEQICEKYEVDWSPNYRLSAEQMGEPMAPPSGYSVPIGTGTGLGPQVIAHTGMTVSVDEDETTYNGRQSLPPPQAPGVGNNNKSNGNNSIDDFNESDFHLPKAPTKKNDPTTPGIPPQAHMAPPPVLDSNTTSTNKLDDDDDDDNDDNNNNKTDNLYNDQPSSDGGIDSASYNDLAARFENLKNL